MNCIGGRYAAGPPNAVSETEDVAARNAKTMVRPQDPAPSGSAGRRRQNQRTGAARHRPAAWAAETTLSGPSGGWGEAGRGLGRAAQPGVGALPPAGMRAGGVKRGGDWDALRSPVPPLSRRLECGRAGRLQPVSGAPGGARRSRRGAAAGRGPIAFYLVPGRRDRESPKHWVRGLWPNSPTWKKGTPPSAKLARGVAVRLRDALDYDDRRAPGRTSARKAAEAAGLSTATVTSIIDGKSWPDIDTVARLERALDITLWGDEHRLSETGPEEEEAEEEAEEEEEPEDLAAASPSVDEVIEFELGISSESQEHKLRDYFD